MSAAHRTWTTLRHLQPIPLRRYKVPAGAVGATTWRRYSSSMNGDTTVGVARLDHSRIDKKWQKIWQEQPSSPHPAQDGDKAYILPMFPYPSGTLHVGHLRIYTIADTLARYARMMGKDVLHPMGWDAFGLPAENAAISRGIDPRKWTEGNIASMKEQLISMNGGWDWDREIRTCDPSFYAHTQRLFLMLLKEGYAYQKEAEVNWDPVDKTVLANEQVDSQGLSWRSGAKVEKKNLRQWFLRITSFQESLLKDLDGLLESGHWPENVVAQQKHWLYKGSGHKVTFDTYDSTTLQDVQQVEVFTTRLDTLFGVQYLALSSSHPLVLSEAEKNPDLKAFLDTADSLPENTKAGFLLPNIKAENPATWLTRGSHYPPDPQLPVYVAPYVIPTAGTGAVMGVPAHDKRDHAFWTENQPGEPIRRAISRIRAGYVYSISHLDAHEEPYTGEGYLRGFPKVIQSRTTQNAREEIPGLLNAFEPGVCEKHEQWKLQDWLISRQRYWGCPIPIVHCPSCGVVPIPESELPVRLPDLEEGQMQNQMGNPLQHMPSWLQTLCPSCGGEGTRETDTMDTFVDSSWYMFRFLSPHSTSQIFSPDAARENMPVDLYVGGVEHAILHLLYARFISKFLASVGAWPDALENAEPFKRLLTQGMVHGRTYTHPDTGSYLHPDLVVTKREDGRPELKSTGEKVKVTYEKMSKSKHNGVDLSACISRHGADATRAHVLFAAPVADVLEWDEEKISGVERWMGRVWRLVHSMAPIEAGDGLSSLDAKEVNEATSALLLALNNTIKSTRESFGETYALNTVVSDLMSLTNTLDTAITSSSIPRAVLRTATEALIKMLSPICPAFGSECWSILHSHSHSYPHSQTTSETKSTTTTTTPEGWKTSIFTTPFPTPLPSSLIRKLKEGQKRPCALQVNGKLRGTVSINQPTGEGQATDQEILKVVLETDEGRRIAGTESLDRLDGLWERVVVVRGGRVVNFVGKATKTKRKGKGS